MAELHRTTLGNTLILEVNATPNAAITAPRGSKAYDSATGDEYVNTDGAQAWTKLAKTGDAPTAHAASHAGGAGDAIADAVAAGAAGLMSGADKTKLDGVEALADVTDLTNVSAALGTTAAAAVTTTNVGVGDAGKVIKLDAAGALAGRVLETDGSKLDGIEALADVTDLANVTTALGVTAAAAVATSAGAGDAGKLPKLDAAGAISYDLALRSGAPVWIRKVITEADLVGGAATEAVVLLASRAAPTLVYDAFFVLDTEFSGGGVGSCTCSIGRAGALTSLVSALNVFTGAGAGIKGDLAANKGADVRDDIDSGGGNTKLKSPAYVAAGEAISAQFTVDTTTGALTAGQLTAFVCIATPQAV